MASGEAAAYAVYDAAYILDVCELRRYTSYGQQDGMQEGIRLGVYCIHAGVRPWCEVCTLEQ